MAWHLRQTLGRLKFDFHTGSDASHSPVKFDLHGLPPTLIQTGQCEVLHDQQVRLCAEIKFHGAFVLNRRIDLHAIDATPAR